MHHIAYFRVSTGDQSIDAQRVALGRCFDQEFSDVAVSGSTIASSRPGFSDLLNRVRAGDTVHVYAVDRLGRDALDVQATVRQLIGLGVVVDVHGLGPIGRGVGELILAVLAQVADMERHRIAERTQAGREAAKTALTMTGRTHRGKVSLGRPKSYPEAAVVAWRAKHTASISQTARHFGLSDATVKRYAKLCKPQNSTDG